MRRNIVLGWLLLLLTFLLPVLLLRGQSLGAGGERPAELLPMHQVEPVGERDGQRQVALLREDGTVEQLSLGEYLWGVVAAEMPASFEAEALKAQAVAARTYWACLVGAESTKVRTCAGSLPAVRPIWADRRLPPTGENGRWTIPHASPWRWSRRTGCV